MKTVCKYALMLFLIVTQQAFSEQELNPSNHGINIKAFPDNDINYFFKNNKAEAWRLVYPEFAKPPYDPNNDNHCDANEIAPDEALAFNISEVIKNAGDNFNIDNFHAYYDGDSGKKALALLLFEPKFKNSFIALGKVLIHKGDSEFAELTPDRLKKLLSILHDDEENTMYVCFSYIQHLIMTPKTQNIEKDSISTDTTINTDSAIDARKIVLWYDGAKATAIKTQPINPKPSRLTKAQQKSSKTR